MNNGPLSVSPGDLVRFKYRDKAGNLIEITGKIVSRRHAVCSNLDAPEAVAPVLVDSGKARLFDGRQYAIEKRENGRVGWVFAYPRQIEILAPRSPA